MLKIQIVLPLLLLQAACERLRFALAGPEGTAAAEVGGPRVTCALSLARTQLAVSTHITVLGRAPWLQGFLRATSVPVTLLSAGADRMQVHNELSDAVFVIPDGYKNASFLEETLVLMRRHDLFYARVVVWWYDGDPQGVVDVALAREMVGLVLVSDAGVFGYRQNCKDGTSVAEAVLLGKCDRGGDLLTKGDLFPDLLRFNLQGCPLRLGAFSTPPLLVPYPNPKGGGFKLAGILGTLIMTLVARTNATLHLNVTFNRLNGSADGVLGDLVFKRSDVFVAEMNRVIRRDDKHTDVCPSFDNTRGARFYVPSGLGAEASVLGMMYREFTLPVWALVGVSYVLVVSALALSGRADSLNAVQDAALLVFSTLLGNTLSVSVTNNTRFRGLTGLWRMACIVFSTAYVAELHSLQAAPTKMQEINSLLQLLESKLPIYVSASDLEVLKKDAQNRGDAVLRALTSRYVMMESKPEALVRMAIRRDKAVFISRLTASRVVGPLQAFYKRKLIHVVPGYVGINKPISYCVLRRGSPLTPILNVLLWRYSGFGLLHNIQKTILHSLSENTNRPISVYDLNAVLHLLVFGMAASTMVFVTEILMKWITLILK